MYPAVLGQCQYGLRIPAWLQQSKYASAVVHSEYILSLSILVVAGATVRVRTDEIFNISMALLDGSIQDNGIWGLRVDFWDDITDSYPPASSLFFYDGGFDFQVRHRNVPLTSGSTNLLHTSMLQYPHTLESHAAIFSYPKLISAIFLTSGIVNIYLVCVQNVRH